MVWGFPAGWQVGLILNSMGTANFISCLKALCNAIGFGFLPIDCPQGDKRNRNTRKPFSQRNSGHHSRPKNPRTDARPHPQPTSHRASARTSTGERRPGGRADWMFLIFLLLFGSSQKEGVRFPNTTVESNENGPGIKILFLVLLRLGLHLCDLESRIRQRYGSLRKPLSQQ
jgi:hypothetical protein